MIDYRYSLFLQIGCVVLVVRFNINDHEPELGSVPMHVMEKIRKKENTECC